MTDQRPQALYSFTVQDKDAEALTFGCLASSLDQAKGLAARAGHRETLLLEIRPLEGVEIPEVARLLASSNPLVGADWLPLVDFMAGNLRLTEVGHAWILDIVPHKNPLAQNSPYAQALLEPDGNIHVEIGPTQALSTYALDNEELADWLGWKRPLDAGLPNFFRAFPPGTSVEFIAGTVIQALTTLFGFSTHDGFSAHHRFSQIKPVVGVERIDPGPDVTLLQPAFGLAGLHRVSFASDCAESRDFGHVTLAEGSP